MKKLFGIPLFILLPVLLLGLHLLFIHADPDPQSTYSRGPFNDEGLYSAQVRNYLNTGTFDLEEGDTVLKGPLYSGLLFMTLSLFGDSQTAIRLLTLICLLISWLVCYFQFPRLKKALLLVFVVVFTNFYFFSFSHYAMVEVIIAAWMLWTCLYFGEQLKVSSLSWGKLIVLQLICCVPVALKFQYVYILILPSVVFLVSYVFYKNKERLKDFAKSVLIVLILSTLLFIIWILPHYDLAIFFLKHQSGDFSVGIESLKNFLFNINYVFLSNPNILLLLALLAALYLGKRKKIKALSTPLDPTILVVAVWLVMEGSKYFFSYFPTRYFLCSLLAIGLIGALLTQRNKVNNKEVYAFTGLILLVHFFLITQSFNRVEYKMANINTYLKKNIKSDRPILGNWATNLTWGLPNRTVWLADEFTKGQNWLKKYEPGIVIAEEDEEYYTKRNMDLDMLSDSSKAFKVANWNVTVYWLSKAY